MTYIGMYGIPIVGEVKSDGVVEFNDEYRAANKAAYRACRKCGHGFRIQGQYDPMIICKSCLDGGAKNR